MAITRKEEPIFVKRPRSASAKGHTAGHTRALAKPSRAMNATETYPCVKSADKVKRMPKIADNFKAFAWEINLGMASTPMKYPATINTNVQVVKNLAVEKAMPCEAP